MRYKFYKRAIGHMKHKKFIALMFILVSMVIGLITNLEKEIMPVLKTVSESKAQAIAVTISNKVIEKHMKEIKYNRLMQLSYDNDGKLTAISADIVEMNDLSAKVIKEIQEELLQVDDIIIEIPLGRILGWSVFSGYGPKIDIRIIPAGNVKANFKTDFTAQGINQTKHSVYIEIDSEMVVVAPLMSETVVASNTVTVAETVIVGEIPNTYLTVDKNEFIETKGN